MASTDEPHSPTLDTPTDPLIGITENHQQPKDESRPGDRFALYTAAASALILLLSTWTIILSSDPTSLSWFAFHPTINTLAISCFIMAILTLQPTSQPKTKAEGLLRHQKFNLTGLLCIALGSSAMFTYKASHGAPHFTTWHATFGLITLALLALQFLFGAGSVWFGGVLFGGGQKAKLVWKYHRLSGYLALLSLVTTAHLGGWSTWVSAHSIYAARIVAYNLAPLGILLSVYSRIRPSKMKFF